MLVTQILVSIYILHLNIHSLIDKLDRFNILLNGLSVRADIELYQKLD
jgi:hypothetical protein